MAASYMIPATPAAAALDKPVFVLGQQFCMPHPVDLTVTGKTFSLTDADFTVADVNGNVVFKVKGKVFSLHDRCSLMDSTGKVILTAQQKVMSAHRRWRVFQGESTDEKDLLYNIKKSSYFQIRTKLDVFLAGNSSEAVPDFRINGSYSERTCTVYLGETNTIIAQMSTHHTAKSILLGKDIFGITVYPHVDYAFIVSLIVVLDQINQDRAD